MTQPMPKRFTKCKDGEWIQPRMQSYYLRCCDCGLIHRINFRVVIERKNMAHVQLQAFRMSNRRKAR